MRRKATNALQSMELLRTDRLVLRPLRVRDITTAYLEALNDPDVVKWTEARYRRWTRASVVDYVRASNGGSDAQLIGIFLRRSQGHIGNIRLSHMSQEHHRADLGIMLFEKSQWSKGYATEALVGITEYAFRQLHLHKMCADYYATNLASARIFAKAGYTIEGIFQHHFYAEGRYIDSVRIAKINDQSHAALREAGT